MRCHSNSAGTFFSECFLLLTSCAQLCFCRMRLCLTKRPRPSFGRALVALSPADETRRAHVPPCFLRPPHYVNTAHAPRNRISDFALSKARFIVFNALCFFRSHPQSNSASAWLSACSWEGMAVIFHEIVCLYDLVYHRSLPSISLLLLYAMWDSSNEWWLSLENWLKFTNSHVIKSNCVCFF